MKSKLIRWIIGVAVLAVLGGVVPMVEGAEELRLTFVTARGEKFENAKVLRVEPDGISLLCASGITKVFFEDLPEEVRERFGMTAERASQYRARVSEAIQAREERMRILDEQRTAEQQALDRQRAAERAKQAKADEDTKKRHAVYTWHFNGMSARGQVLLVQDDHVLIRKPGSVGKDGTWCIHLSLLPSSERALALWIGERMTPEERRSGEHALHNYEKWLYH